VLTVAVPTDLTDKTSHFGRAGQFVAMAELLARGWNVAVPEVDVGDDVFTAHDDGSQLIRLQIKTSRTVIAEDGSLRAQFTLWREQLFIDEEVRLFYVFVTLIEARWRFVVIDRKVLGEIRRQFEKTTRPGPGRRPSASGDWINFEVQVRGDAVRGWGCDLLPYAENWNEFPIVMQRRREAARAPASSPARPLPTDRDEGGSGDPSPPAGA